MQRMSLRVAYFPDSFHEVNGVAHTSRNFVAYAQRHGLPFLCVRAGQRATAFEQDGELRTLELQRSPMKFSLERDLYFDLMFPRYRKAISEAVRAFQPDVIHITGPSELGMFGAYFAWKLKIPLAASWHTNVHEYLARRMRWLNRNLGSVGETLDSGIERTTLDATSRFYKLAKVLYAPNPELCALLERKTDRPCHLMQRGVETEVFTPAKRTRGGDKKIVLGFVGRLSVEKNVALLPKIDRELRAMGLSPEWLIVGHGGDEEELRRDFAASGGTPVFAGVLRGEALAEAYANMDLLVFPSHTDTFGNVVLEALASGVPAIVSPDGGPAHIVRAGAAVGLVTGRIATDEAFAASIEEVLADKEAYAAMRLAARQYALRCSWDVVFDRVYAAYPMAMGVAATSHATI